MSVEGRKKRILLVDDEPRNVAVLEGFLAPLGHELVRALDGRSALALFESSPFDLVLLDLVMPGFEGLDVLAHIRADPSRAHVPIIIVTAHGEREKRIKAIEAGANEFLEKPVDSAILLARVRTLLELKEGRDELNARNATLERLQRTQRELTQFLVHDLRSPLAVVSSNLGWIREEISKEKEEVIEALIDAAEATRRLQQMVDDLLTVARLDEAEFPVRFESVELASLVRSLVGEHEQKAKQRDVKISSNQADAIVRADPMLLKRVIENLLDNSLRHTPSKGHVHLEVRKSDHVEICVSNDGPPIPEDERSRIFDKFYRVERDRSSMRTPGLGLYFCKRALDAQGGEISVVDSADWATTFVVRLPEAS
ncbi:MAG: hybrid sensor histidine kinase/response regulator [Polyangiaceae bacterium]